MLTLIMDGILLLFFLLCYAFHHQHFLLLVHQGFRRGAYHCEICQAAIWMGESVHRELSLEEQEQLVYLPVYKSSNQ